MKMFISRFVAYSITALMTCGLVIQLAQAQAPNFKCVPQLSPATCASGGNSVCNALAGDGTCPTTNSCFYCDDPNTPVASAVCVVWETQTCEIDPNQKPAECNMMANKMAGTCGLDGSCLCLNQNPNGECGNTNLVVPCITP